MQIMLMRWILFVVVSLSGLVPSLYAKALRLRAMWRDDPATTMVIGWDQVSGTSPLVLYDVVDHGDNVSAYRYRQIPARAVVSKGMHNHYARFSGLSPNTVYYFIIRDSEGQSRRMTFQTAPNDPRVRLSIIAGGDSRNFREARQDANRLVGKLRPHVVLFNGDMTSGDTGAEWIEWFDDWQLTMGSDGRLFPVLVARGNHEESNPVLYDLFDTPSPDIYYALTLGGNLLRLYTLNSMIPVGGDQQAWLDRDLRGNGQVVWKFAQYHLSTRPHTAGKAEKDEQLLHWSTLFYKYRVSVAIESDAHVVKTTWPIRPSREVGSDQGFIRDDENGTVYLGEGCWGAPLRANDDNKRWTRNSGSFNSFHWIFVDQYSVEARVVKTDGSDRVGEVSPADPFKPPYGLVIWSPSNGEVVTIRNANAAPVAETAVRTRLEVDDMAASAEGADVSIVWNTTNEGESAAFELQRSVDGGARYVTIAIIPGKGAGRNRYAFIDPGITRQGPMARVRYRINCRQPDFEDRFYDFRPFAPPGPAPGAAVTTAPPPPPGSLPVALADERGQVLIRYTLTLPANVDLILIGSDMRELARLSYPNQPPGPYEKSLDLSKAPTGNYSLVVKANGQLLTRYQVRR